jgi:hypothetical protein
VSSNNQQCQQEPPSELTLTVSDGFCFLVDASHLLERASVHIHEDHQRPQFDFEEASQILATLRAFIKSGSRHVTSRDTGAVNQGILLCRLSVASPIFIIDLGSC